MLRSDRNPIKERSALISLNMIAGIAAINE
jgi:hypothetical protein